MVGYRGEFADAQLAYLRALKNTGVTLRQFSESDTLELENTSYALTLPPSPPSPLPPSPPPPPSFSPDSRKASDNRKGEVAKEESIDINQDGGSTPLFRSASLSWNDWDIFESTSPLHRKQSEIVEPVAEENLAGRKVEFEDENQGEELVENIATSPLPEKPQHGEIVDDNSSMMSWYDKDSRDGAMVVWKKKKSLEGIIKELDDFFLEASAGGKAIALFTDKNIGDNSLPWKLNENKKKRSNSTKVFSALSWSWSSKSLQFARDAVQCGSNEPCKPGAHCITLDKLYATEQKLYKEVKEEESTKLELERKLAFLQKQDENQDYTKTKKIKLSIENVENVLRRLEHSISTSCSSILELIDEELYPQMDTLTSGLMEMWKMMYKCHKVQNLISQQLNLVTDLSIDLTTEFHHQATAQLETEVSFWYYSFCKLMKSQQDYARTLCRWIQCTDCLANDNHQGRCSSAVCRLCKEWQHGFEKLPDKVASEAIWSFLLAIQVIIKHQAEQRYQQKKSDKLEERLQKELMSLTELEKKVEGSVADLDVNSSLSPKHPLSLKRAKIEALKKRALVEKDKHLDSVQVNKTMTLNNLKTSLPKLFQALMGFSKASAQVFESVHDHARPGIQTPCNDASENSAN
ncbi:putative Root phototropism protein [Hibiscus syriacus]|uniref:Root phototropism protein n=1 Tax=Hibiscus syriacus TaxID=106335 RepID=A0A6A3BJP3_HIBSY|nr:putative Root phototropism protein [Hibiscus syriacus]